MWNLRLLKPGRAVGIDEAIADPALVEIDFASLGSLSFSQTHTHTHSHTRTHTNTHAYIHKHTYVCA